MRFHTSTIRQVTVTDDNGAEVARVTDRPGEGVKVQVLGSEGKWETVQLTRPQLLAIHSGFADLGDVFDPADPDDDDPDPEAPTLPAALLAPSAEAGAATLYGRPEAA